MGKGASNQSAKKRGLNNESWNTKANTVLYSSNLIYLILAAYTYFYKEPFSQWKLAGIATLIFAQFYCLNAIKNARASLGARASYDYYMDVLIISGFVLHLSLVTDYAWYVLYTIPLYAVYKIGRFVFSFFFSATNGGSENNGQDEETLLEKLEKKNYDDMTKSERKKYRQLQKRKERKERGKVRYR